MEFANWKLMDIVQPEKKIERFVYLFVAKRALQCFAPRLNAGESVETITVLLPDVVRQDNVLRHFPIFTVVCWCDGCR